MASSGTAAYVEWWARLFSAAVAAGLELRDLPESMTGRAHDLPDGLTPEDVVATAQQHGASALYVDLLPEALVTVDGHSSWGASVAFVDEGGVVHVLSTAIFNGVIAI